MKMLRSGVAAALTALALLAPAAASAAPGELDPSFGAGGKALTPLSYGGGVAVQPDGKVLVAGGGPLPEFRIMRLLPNGSPDPTWGVNGIATTPLGVPAASTDVTVQPDGKVVAVGNAGSPIADFTIVRYLPNGAPDPSFGGGDGVVEVPIGSEGNRASAVAVGPGGRIGVTGYTRLPGSKHGAAVVVLEADGTPEAAFSADGIFVIETESEGDDRGEGIAFQPDGKLVIADSTGGGIGDGFTIVRLGLDGSPDPSFGGAGVVETPIPGEGEIAYGRVSDVVVQPDGKIVGGGYGADYGGTPPEYTAKFALVRYLPGGELDPSFGSGGIVSTRLSGGHAFGRSLALTPTGKLLIGGTWEPPRVGLVERYAPALLRYTSSGSLDPSFGSGGVVQLPASSPFEDESIESIALAPDGKILTGGEGYPEEGESSVLVSRYLGDPLPVTQRLPDVAPDTKMKKVPHKIRANRLRRFSGTASDSDSRVAKVQISLVRVGRGKKHRRAVKPRHWRTAKGRAKWAYKLPHRLKPGRYVVFSRAIDDTGLAEEGFSRRDGNRYAFRVLPVPSP